LRQVSVFLNGVVAIVALTSLQLNSTAIEQARTTAKAQIELSRQLADAAARQAEASIAAAKTSQDSMVASQRAWVGPTDATIVTPVALAPLQATVLFSNTGRQPAPTFMVIKPKFYTIEDWTNGLASKEIERARAECMALPMNDQNASVTFPTSGFTNFIRRYDGTQKSLRDVERLSIPAEFLSGKQVVVLKGCFVSRTVDEIHRTSFCYFYQSKITDAAHLNYCAAGQAAN
jgi:hypothetical protein